MPQRSRIPALQRLPTAAALLGRTGHHDLHLLERDQHPRMGWMAGLPTALAARGLWGRTPLHAWPIARRGPGGVLRILIDTVFERSQFGLERRNALLVPLNQYLQRGLDIRRDPVPELFGQRQLSLAHAASHIPVPVFPQVPPMNAYVIGTTRPSCIGSRGSSPYNSATFKVRSAKAPIPEPRRKRVFTRPLRLLGSS